MSALTQFVHRIAQPLRAPLARFGTWWFGELAMLVPARWRSGIDDGLDSSLLAFHAGTLSVSRRQGDRWVEVAQRKLDDLDQRARQNAVRAMLKMARMAPRAPLALALPPDQVLRREIELPLAAEQAMRSVLGFEIDRYTPFRADQVYYAWREIGRDPALGRIRVLLAVVPRGVLDTALAQLDRLELAPAAALVVDDLRPRMAPLDFLPEERRPRRGLRWTRIHMALAGLAGVLALATLILPLAIKRQASIELLPVAQRADEGARAVERLRGEVKAAQDGYNALVRRKEAQPSPLATLLELSQLLPDDTWVQQLSLVGGNLQIQGDTGSSSKLIGLIAGSRILGNANFASALTKSQGNDNAERYTLTARVQAAAPPAAAHPAPVTTPAPHPAPAAHPASAPHPAAAHAASAPRPAPAAHPASAPHPAPVTHPASAPHPAAAGKAAPTPTHAASAAPARLPGGARK